MKKMSDPVKSSEIEDVLSSIRRLVSEEARSDKQTRRNDAPKAPANVPEQARPKAPEADALVLTPALRVHSGGLSNADADAARGAREPDAVRDAVMNVVADVVEAETEAQVAAAFEPAEDAAPMPEVAAYQVAAENAPEAGDYSVSEAAEVRVPDAEEGALEPDVVEQAPFVHVDDLPEPPAAAETLESKLTALEALIAGQNETAAQHPSESEDAETAQEWQDHLPESGAPDVGTAEADAADVERFEAPHDAPEVHEPAAEEAALAEERDDLDAPTVEDTPPQAEVAGDFTKDVTDHLNEAPDASPTTKIQRPAMASAEARPGPEVAEEDEARLPDTEEDHSIDESVLRQMVVDIVREELQGALGERITRNVRRLVRREIHRALASHELE